ncbi:hypothetical protein [Halobellus limi]|uniref:ABC-2 type transport system permease protein n=1 Tax=Halobellus limi TaxID=699433 RepID=A0A1H6BDJ0_9EURY|nr:hypothetical protein [Halobellus limi]QCC49262.1 hypothetical protein DV707_16070 [Halobellus limi]SEG58266.1 hypothetical protein SAMN04488133_2741 [Halobellus limi]
MSLRSDLRYGLRIARAEFVRSLRGYARDRRRLLGLAAAVLFFGGNLVFSLPTAYLLGRTVRSADAVPFLGPAATALPFLLLSLAALRTLERIGSPEAEELLLSTVHPRAAVVGLICAEIARLLAWFGIPIAAVVAAFALGLGSATFPLTVAVVVLPLVCWAAVWGYAIGIGLLRLFRRLPALGRAVKVGGFLGMLALVLASQSIGRLVADGSLSARGILDAVTLAPLSEYVALAFVGTPLAQPLSPTGLGVLFLAVALTPLGLAVATRSATTLWFGDASRPERATRSEKSTGGFAAPPPFAATKPGRIAWGHLVRAVRHPQEFSHLVMIVFFLGPVGTTFVQSSGDALGPLAAATGVGLATYLAGATFGLNPIGDDRPQLPLVLLTGTAPRTLVRGRIAAGVAIAAPVAVLVPTAALGLGTAPKLAAAFAGVGLPMCVAASLFAVGLGTSYPIYEEREFWGAETVVPSTLVMMAYLFVVSGGTVVGLFATWFAVSGRLVVTPLVAGGLSLYLLVTVGLSYGSYRYAVRRYRRYTLD